LNIKSLLKDSVVYGITKYFGAFAAIFLTPIYTRILSKADYGVLDIFSTWSNLIVMILPLGLIASVVRFYPDFSDNLKEKKKNLGTIFYTLLILSLLYSVLMVGLKDILFDTVFNSQISEETYYLSIIIVVGEIFKSYFLVQLQVKFRKYSYLISSLLGLIVLTAFGFLFVYHYEMGVVGFFRASVLSLGVSIIFLLLALRKELYLAFDWKTLMTLLSYSIHLLFASFLTLFTRIIDRYLMLEYFSLEDVGVYSIGIKISSIIGITTAAFTIAWFPLAMKVKDSESATQTYNKVHNLYFTVVLPFLALLFIFRKELIFIFAPTYQDAYNIIAILGIYTIVNSSIFFYSLGLHIKNKTKYITISAIIGILLNIVISLILLRYLGIDGIAYGTLIGAIVSILIQYYYSNKFLKIGYNLLLTGGVFIMLFITMYLTPYFDNLFIDNTFNNVVFKISLSLIIIVGTYLIGIRNRYKNLKFE
jgi:O-antigen/teichoic acid export membrane protein